MNEPGQSLIEGVHPLSKVKPNVYPVDTAVLSKENSNCDDCPGVMTRLAAVQPDVIAAGGMLQPISQIVPPFQLT